MLPSLGSLLLTPFWPEEGESHALSVPVFPSLISEKESNAFTTACFLVDRRFKASRFCEVDPSQTLWLI